MTIEISINPQISLDEIIDSIYRDCSHEDIIQFIIDLDLRVAEYEFTSSLIQKLRQSFEPDRVAELKEKPEHVPKDVAEI